MAEAKSNPYLGSSVPSTYCILWWISLGDCKGDAVREFLSVAFHSFKCQMWGCFYLRLFYGKSGIHRRDSSSTVIITHFPRKTLWEYIFLGNWRGRETINQVKLGLKCKCNVIGHTHCMGFSSHFLRIITGRVWVDWLRYEEASLS